MINDDTIKKLENLTPRLPIVPETQAVTSYPIRGGGCEGYGLWRDDAVAVQRFRIYKGTKFPSQTYDAREWLIVYDGLLRITIKGGTEEIIDVVPAEHVCLEFNTSHMIEALEDTWGVRVTVPRRS